MFPASLMGLDIHKFKNLEKLINDKKFVSSLIQNVASIHTLNMKGSAPTPPWRNTSGSMDISESIEKQAAQAILKSKEEKKLEAARKRKEAADERKAVRAKEKADKEKEKAAPGRGGLVCRKINGSSPAFATLMSSATTATAATGALACFVAVEC